MTGAAGARSVLVLAVIAVPMASRPEADSQSTKALCQSFAIGGLACFSGSVSWSENRTGAHGSEGEAFTITVDTGDVSCVGHGWGERPWTASGPGSGGFSVNERTQPDGGVETEVQGAFHCPADRPVDINRNDVIIPPQVLKKWPVDEISGDATMESRFADPLNGITGSAHVHWQLGGKEDIRVEIEGPRCGCVQSEGAGPPVRFSAHASVGGGTFSRFEVEPQGKPPQVLVNAGGTAPRLELAPSAETGLVTLGISYTKGGRSYASAPLPVSFCVQDPIHLADDDKDLAFDGSGVGRLELGAFSRAWYNGAEVSPELSWSLEKMPDPTQRVPEMKSGARVVLAYEHLPVANTSFGAKTVTAKLHKEECHCERNTTVRTFYLPTGTNHPALSGSGDVTPNWFYYWMQTAASASVDRSIVKYNNGAGSAGNFQDPSEVAALYDEEKDLVLIRDQTFTHSCRPRVDQATHRPTGVASDGIDCFAETLRHESQHRADWKAWWPPSTVLPKGYDILEDPDLDGVPASVENGEPGCSNFSKKSCSRRPFPDVTDREINAYYAGWTWAKGSANGEDWSCGARGKQWHGMYCSP